MKDYQSQLLRIIEKLKIAKAADSQFEVFGSNGHEYQLNPPIEMSKVEDFECANDIVLPIEYKLFVTEVGNGGPSFKDSGAGPFFGIFPFGEGYRLQYTEWDAYQLTSPTILFPNMSDEYWNEKIDNLYEKDDEYEKRVAELYGGIFVIGTQGCTYYHGLVLDGEYKGRIINIDLEHQKPYFSYEENFLDWYERWLDDVIDGNLTKENAGSFGYQMGGKEAELIQQFLNLNDSETKKEILSGLLYKRKILDENLNILSQKYEQESLPIQILILQILLYHHYPTAKIYLTKMYDKSILDALQLTHWYIKTDYEQWVDMVKSKINTIDDAETFDFATYILLKSENPDFSIIAQFINNSDVKMRKTVLYTLSLAKNKKDFEQEFLKGLSSENTSELIQALQSIDGLKTTSILKKLKELVIKHPYRAIEPDENGMIIHNSNTDEAIYITSNLKSVLEEFGLDHKRILSINCETYIN